MGKGYVRRPPLDLGPGEFRPRRDGTNLSPSSTCSQLSFTADVYTNALRPDKHDDDAPRISWDDDTEFTDAYLSPPRGYRSRNDAQFGPVQKLPVEIDEELFWDAKLYFPDADYGCFILGNKVDDQYCQNGFFYDPVDDGVKMAYAFP